MVAICLFNEFRDFVFVYIPDRKYYLYTFSKRVVFERFDLEFDSTFPIKMLAKATAILVPMAVPCV